MKKNLRFLIINKENLQILQDIHKYIKKAEQKEKEQIKKMMENQERFKQNQFTVQIYGRFPK